MEEVARTDPQLLDGLVDEDWARRYGRPVRMASQPTHPAARLAQAGADAAALLHRVHAAHLGRPAGGQVEILRQILVQNFVTDGRGRLRARQTKDGQPPARLRIESPYETQARWVRRGNTRWTGYLVHVTETCNDTETNIITDVATDLPRADVTAQPGIHTRLKRRRLLPRQHLVDGGYTSVAQMDAAARSHRIQIVGPLKPGNSWQRKDRTGFAREDFTIDFDKRQITCPRGKVSGNWLELPAMAPYTVVRFSAAHCAPCPVRSSCTSGKGPRTVNFLPRHLHELQAQNRADQHDPDWRRLYARRSGVEGTVDQLVNGHQMRRCRYRGQAKTHVQHVLTAIAINISRLSQQEPACSAYRPRQPTAFQKQLENHGLPRPRWWRQGH